jgi:hypothetical protein
MESQEIPPEVPSLVEATIVQHPTSGRDCLFATTEDGERVAFGFEVESDAPGLVLVDPDLWLAAADQGSPERGPLRLAAVEDPRADDWLQALIAHPVGADWLKSIKQAHPDAYHQWFAHEDYEEGGEGGAG